MSETGSMGMPAAEFEIDRLQKCCAEYRDEIERLTTEVRSTFESGYQYGLDDARHNYPPRPQGAYNEWRKTAVADEQNSGVEPSPGGMRSSPLKPSISDGDRPEPNSIAEKYQELIYEVATKWPGETRHETAKRYIHERENQPLRCASADTAPQGGQK